MSRQSNRTHNKICGRGAKPPKKFTYQIRSKLARKLALQWDRLILKQGVLHCLYIFNEMEYHQFFPSGIIVNYLRLFRITWAIRALTEHWICFVKGSTGLQWPKTLKIGLQTAVVAKLLGAIIISPSQKSVIWKHTILWI